MDFHKASYRWSRRIKVYVFPFLVFWNNITAFVNGCSDVPL